MILPSYPLFLSSPWTLTFSHLSLLSLLHKPQWMCRLLSLFSTHLPRAQFIFCSFFLHRLHLSVIPPFPSPSLNQSLTIFYPWPVLHPLLYSAGLCATWKLLWLCCNLICFCLHFPCPREVSDAKLEEGIWGSLAAARAWTSFLTREGMTSPLLK